MWYLCPWNANLRYYTKTNPRTLSSDSVKCFRLTFLPIKVIHHVLQQFLQQSKGFFLINPVNFNFCITYGRDCNTPVSNKIKFKKFKSSRLLDRKEWYTARDVSRHQIALVFKTKQSKNSKAPRSSEMSSLYQTTRCNIPEDLNPQKHRCEDLKCRKVKSTFQIYSQSK